MSESWAERRLGDLCRFQAGSVFKPDYQGSPSGDYPFIKVSDMNLPGNEVAIRHANNWISGAQLKEMNAKLHPAGATVFAKIGVALTYNRRRLLTSDTIIDNNMMSAVPAPSELLPRFFYYLLNTLDFNEIVSGTALPYLTVADLKQLKVRVPPTREQAGIAKILSALDDKIELNRKMNETLEGIARAIFKSWFVDFDPVRAKMEGRQTAAISDEIATLFSSRVVSSELGEIPEGWQVRSLDEIGRFLNGLAMQKYPPTGGRSLPVIKIVQLRAGHTQGADLASAELDRDYVVEDGDVLFSWSGSLECKLWAGGRGALNQHLFKVTSTEYPKWFYYFAVHSHLAEFREIAAGKATTMGHIQRHHLSAAKVAVPPKALLEAANAIMEPLVESTWRLLIQSRTLATLRDTLLPKLISGEVRIKDVANVAEAAV